MRGFDVEEPDPNRATAFAERTRPDLQTLTSEQMPSEDPDADAEPPITTAQIRQRAYDLWERNHRPEGFEMQFWLLAERELRAERARRAKQGRKAEAGPDAAPPDPPADRSA